jgi:polyphosphate kinase
VEKLEDRAYRFSSQAAEPVLVESAQWLTRDLDRTVVGPVDSADAIEQGALPGS